jgi:hypothetical protein
MTREEELERALSDVLDVMDSKEMKGQASMAWLHGFRVDLGISNRNGKVIEMAYKLLGRERQGLFVSKDVSSEN